MRSVRPTLFAHPSSSTFFNLNVGPLHVRVFPYVHNLFRIFRAPLQWEWHKKEGLAMHIARLRAPVALSVALMAASGDVLGSGGARRCRPGCQGPWINHVDGIRRYHGLGEPCYFPSSGVRRFHGLGDGYGSYRYWGRDVTAPYRVIVVNSAPPLIVQPAVPPPASGAAPSTAAPPVPPPADQAWSHLAEGDARAALRDFAILALRSMDDAVPKAGYGLAATCLGRDETAFWAMRRAVETDARALAWIGLDDRVVPVILAALDRYEQLALAHDTDSLFMTAALHAMLGEVDAARAAIDRAWELGDRDPSTEALRETLAGGSPNRPAANEPP